MAIPCRRLPPAFNPDPRRVTPIDLRLESFRHLLLVGRNLMRLQKARGVFDRRLSRAIDLSDRADEMEKR